MKAFFECLATETSRSSNRHSIVIRDKAAEPDIGMAIGAGTFLNWPHPYETARPFRDTQSRFHPAMCSGQR